MFLIWNRGEKISCNNKFFTKMFDITIAIRKKIAKLFGFIIVRALVIRTEAMLSLAILTTNSIQIFS